MNKIVHFLLATLALCSPIILLLAAFHIVDISNHAVPYYVFCLMFTLSWVLRPVRVHYKVGLLPWVRIGKDVCKMVGLYCLAIAASAREVRGVFSSAEQSLRRRA